MGGPNGAESEQQLGHCWSHRHHWGKKGREPKGVGAGCAWGPGEGQRCWAVSGARHGRGGWNGNKRPACLPPSSLATLLWRLSCFPPGSHWCAERGQSGRHLRGGINQVVGPRHEETSAHHWSLVKPLCLQYRLSAFGILSNYDGLRTVLPIPKSLFHFGCYPG